MGLLLFIVGSLMVIAALLSIVGMTTHDIRNIRRQLKLPSNNTKRKRPLVTIIIPDDICDACISSIRHSLYPKKEIILAGEPVNGALILLPVKAHVFEAASIGKVVRQMTQDPSRASVEILRTYMPPHTLFELLRVYRDIAVAPFIAVREAFGITLTKTRWSIMVKPSVPRHILRTWLYSTLRWLMSCASIVALMYSCYLASVLYQPAYLEIYLAGFGVWLGLAVCYYPYFSLRQKIAYIILAPVSFVYFALLALYAPFRPLVQRVRTAIAEPHWQSSHQPMA